MKYIVTVNGDKYEVEVEQAGDIAPANVQTAAPAVKSPAAGKTTISAPMPGTILAVKVDKGQQVKKGQILIVLEAMKMENEILAVEDGVVADIAVTKGAQVNTGDALVTIE